jgi:hypothetical protein
VAFGVTTSRAGAAQARCDSRGRRASRGKLWALILGGLTLGTSWAGGQPAPVPKTDEELLAFSLGIEGCVGVVRVLRRSVDSGPHGEYTEFLDVRPLRWFSGTCGTGKLRLYSQPHSSFGFLSTGDWEVGPRDTVIVLTYSEKGRTFVSQTPHTLWKGLARATPERIQFLEANVPRILERGSPGRWDSTR